MKYKVACTAALLLTLVGSTVLAGSDSKVGTAGALELSIPVGTRGVALGGAVVANPLGIESIYWNPAGLASIVGTEATFSFQPYLADMDMNFFGVATTIESFGTIAGSARVLSVGDIEETTEQQPEGTGRIYNPTLSVITVSYARDLTASVALGVNASIIHESVFEANATGLSFDFGATYRPQWEGLTIGIAIKNFGPKMEFSGNGFDRRFEGNDHTVNTKPAGFELPSNINLGMAYNFLNQGMNSATLLGNFNSNNFSPDVWNGGVEYAYNNRYFLRAGYNLSTGSGDAEGIYGITLGAGLEYPMGENSMLKIGYAWNQTDVFDDNQYFSVGMSF